MRCADLGSAEQGATTLALSTCRIESMKDQLNALTAEELIDWMREEFGAGLVMSTSFGIQSAVTLHLTSRICPSIPVIWVDTGYLPEETYQYARTLTELLNLNLHVAQATLSPAEMEARYGRLWESEHVEDLDLYDRMRKVEPMQQALESLHATGWISGLRAEQTEVRRRLPRVQREGTRHRIHPLLPWTSSDVCCYIQEHRLPQHPLFFQGYTTVGDAHSSRPRRLTDEDDRATRFRGLKQECGLHLS